MFEKSAEGEHTGSKKTHTHTHIEETNFNTGIHLQSFLSFYFFLLCFVV